MSSSRSRFRSAILHGRVMHHRSRPVHNAFSYPAGYFLFDVDELPRLDRAIPGFGYNRPMPISLYDRDYGRPPVLGIRAGIEQFLAANGHNLPPTRIELLTQARILGYVFNPVSYFYCFDSRGAIHSVVAEVNNTFGDRIRYLLSEDKRVARSVKRCYRQPKQMHVSPFMPMELEYLWQFDRTADRLTVHMDEFDHGEKFFAARISGRLCPFTGSSLLRTVLRFPLMPVQIISLIHWQALKLYLKRAPYFARPPFEEDWAAVRRGPLTSPGAQAMHARSARQWTAQPGLATNDEPGAQ